MSEAPEKIWADMEPGVNTHGDWSVSRAGGPHAYHLARPNQPCSTDEFLRLAEDKSSKGYDISWRVVLWVDGCFTAAMEGLQ